MRLDKAIADVITKVLSNNKLDVPIDDQKRLFTPAVTFYLCQKESSSANLKTTNSLPFLTKLVARGRPERESNQTRLQSTTQVSEKVRTQVTNA